MSTSERPHLTRMLEEASQSLDQIFGTGSYWIEWTGDVSAVLHTQLADFQFTDDPRDFVSASIISVPDVPVVQSPLDSWMSFLDRDLSPQSRKASYREQMQAELEAIAILVEQILLHPATARDAAWFVQGYNRAYNHWASRKGSWTEVDFNK